MSEILVTGDIFLGDNTIENIAERGDFEKLFGGFTSLISDSTLSITNLESPITDSKHEEIIKTGPTLKSSKKSLKVLKNAGFDLVTLANNHIMDYGKQGLESTMEECKKVGLDYVGVGGAIEQARQPFIANLDNQKIAIINIAENEFSTIGPNPYGANPLDLIYNSTDIRKAKSSNDFVIVIIHGGREHYNLPSPNFKKTLRFFAESGADAVIAHHTHCVSGYEVYNDTPIFYGLGNFHFKKLNNNPNNRPLWNSGLAVKLLLNKDSTLNFALIPYNQCIGDSSTIDVLEGEPKKKFLSNLKDLNKIILDDNLLKTSWERYISYQKQAYKSLFFVRNRWIRKFVNRKLIPLSCFINKSHETYIINMIRCETHREILLDSLLDKHLHCDSNNES